MKGVCKKRVLMIEENPFGNMIQEALWKQVGRCGVKLRRGGRGVV